MHVRRRDRVASEFEPLDGRPCRLHHGRPDQSLYELGLPAGTPVCFVGLKGEFTITGPSPSPPPAADDASSSASVTFPYSIVIYTESPWRVVESGEQLQQPTPDAG
jgi:hypothetical protein